MLVAGRSQGDGDEGLGFTALEQGGAVDAGQQVDLAGDVTQLLGAAAIRTRAGENQIANDPLLQVVPATAEVFGADGSVGVGVGNHFRQGPFLEGAHGFSPGQLALGLLGRFEVVVVGSLEPVVEPTVVGRGEFRFLRLDFLDHLPLQLAEFDDVGVGLHDGVGHRVLGHFPGEAFDHQNGVFRARDDQVKIARFEIVVRGEGDELAVNQAEADRGDGALEGHGRQAQGHGGAVHGQHVAVGLPVTGQHEGLDLDLVVESLGEERADRTVDEPGGEGFLQGGAAFPLQESTRKFAGGGDSLAVVAHEGEEVDAWAWGSGDARCQDDRFVEPDKATSGGLFGQFTGFEPERPASNLFFYTYFQFLFLPSPTEGVAERDERGAQHRTEGGR